MTASNSTAAVNPISLLKDNKEGTIFMEDGIWKTYLMIFTASFFFFSFVLLFWKVWFDKVWKDEKYLALKDTEKWYYLSNWAGNCHHIIIFTYVMWVGYN